MRRALPPLLLGLAALLLVAELVRAPPPDTRLTLDPEGTRPFDTRVARELLPAWLGAPVETVEAAPYAWLADPGRTGTYLFVTDRFAPDEAETARLLGFVRRGGTLFVAAQEMGGPLADSLGRPYEDGPERLSFGHGLPYPAFGRVPGLFEGDSLLTLDAPGLARPEGYRLPLGARAAAVYNLDPARTTVLGRNGDGMPTFVRIREGRGQVLLLGTALPFTNAALVREGDGADFLAGVLAYLPPSGPVYWDASALPFRAGRSALRVVMATPALRWAYLLTLLGALLYALFRGRRWQRAVPVVASPPNAQRAFARTVGRLYYVHGDHGRLARRLARHAEDGLRTRLHLPGADLSDASARRAAARAGVPEDEAAALFADLRKASAPTAPPPSPDALVALDRRLHRFFHAAPPAP